jgi:predicted lipoprotein with Yx(FWY)xxD motif
MWYTAQRIAVAFMMVAVSAGAASAQYNAPATPSTPTAPSSPAPAPSVPAPATGTSGTVTYPYAVNVALTGDNKVILTDGQGMTLYYLTNETGLAPICTGPCASVWPPTIAPAGAGAAQVSGDPALSPMTVATDANGTQIAYHGHLLYRYTKDTAAGQMNGDRVTDSWGTWAVATPDLPYRP